MSAESILRPRVTPSDSVKPLINIGALMDITTGEYVLGKYGESLLNGGLGALTGIVGIGNNFKSTIAHYQSLSALSKIAAAVYTALYTFDTEVNTHFNRLAQLAKRFFPDQDILKTGMWTVSDATKYLGNEWYETQKEYFKTKEDNRKELTVEYPFLSGDNKHLLTNLIPTFGEVDSLTEFVTKDVEKMQNENEIGDSGANTLHMRLGLVKTRIMMEIPTRIAAANHYMVITAHVGKNVEMASGPFAPPPTKKLTYLKNNDKIKGVGDKFFFALSNLWHAYNAAPLINQSTKGEEYPPTRDDPRVGSTDLNIVTLRQLRSKSGPAGIVIQLIVSQREGVLPTLTEFHYIKNMNRFGLNGNNVNYKLDLYPEVNLTRTTIREKIDTDPLLQRAINITSELCQLIELHADRYKDVLCTPKELYDDLVALGYDWNILLQTRGWWTVNNDTLSVPFLSTMDLLRIRKGLYKPYWLKDA